MPLARATKSYLSPYEAARPVGASSGQRLSAPARGRPSLLVVSYRLRQAQRAPSAHRNQQSSRPQDLSRPWHSRAGAVLTIRSSGPLRWVAVLSCGGQQRPLSSSVRARTIRLRYIAEKGESRCRSSNCPILRRSLARLESSCPCFSLARRSSRTHGPSSATSTIRP